MPEISVCDPEFSTQVRLREPSFCYVCGRILTLSPKLDLTLFDDDNEC
jgi:hypothetical protein